MEVNNRVNVIVSSFPSLSFLNSISTSTVVQEEFKWTSEEIARWIHMIFRPVYLVIGTIGNGLTFYIMRKTSLKDVSSCFYMSLLALADTSKQILILLGLVNRSPITNSYIKNTPTQFYWWLEVLFSGSLFEFDGPAERMLLRLTYSPDTLCIHTHCQNLNIGKHKTPISLFWNYGSLLGCQPLSVICKLPMVSAVKQVRFCCNLQRVNLYSFLKQLLFVWPQALCFLLSEALFS